MRLGRPARWRGLGAWRAQRGPGSPGARMSMAHPVPEGRLPEPVTVFGPDFPFPYDDWLRHRAGLGSIPDPARGATVAVVGAGLAGLVAAHELMELGLRPVVYERARIGGRLRSHEFEGA